MSLQTQEDRCNLFVIPASPIHHKNTLPKMRFASYRRQAYSVRSLRILAFLRQEHSLLRRPYVKKHVVDLNAPRG